MFYRKFAKLAPLRTAVTAAAVTGRGSTQRVSMPNNVKTAQKEPFSSDLLNDLAEQAPDTLPNEDQKKPLETSNKDSEKIETTKTVQPEQAPEAKPAVEIKKEEEVKKEEPKVEEKKEIAKNEPTEPKKETDNIMSTIKNEEPAAAPKAN